MIKHVLIGMSCIMVFVICITMNMTKATSSDEPAELHHSNNATNDQDPQVRISTNDDIYEEERAHRLPAPKSSQSTSKVVSNAPMPTNMSDINEAISTIDNEIITDNLIELANDQALGTEDMERLQKLLRARDKLFEMKVSLILQGA